MGAEIAPVVITRDDVLRAAGFKPIEDLKRAVTRNRQALNAVRPGRRTETSEPDGSLTVKIEHGGAPDWDARLKAVELFYDLGDVRKPREEQDASSGRPIAVAIFLDGSDGGPPRPPLPTDGVRVHLARGDGG